MNPTTVPTVPAPRITHRDGFLAFGLSEHYQAKLKTKDDAEMRVLVSASPLLDDDGQYAGALAMVTDVTAVGEAEEILNSQGERLRTEVAGGLLAETPTGASFGPAPEDDAVRTDLSQANERGTMPERSQARD